MVVRVLQGYFRDRKTRNETAFQQIMDARERLRELSDENLRAVFNFMDVSGDGGISVAEFTGAFRKANM